MATTEAEELSSRKSDHIDLTLGADVGYRRTTLLEQVELTHCSLPELDFGDIDTRLELFGKRLRAPLLVTGMTGGNERAGEINRKLAEVAERGGFALGLGSQRPMVRSGDVDEEVLSTYAIRALAPSVPLLGNIGVVQASRMSIAQLEDMVGRVEVDALCVHLNPAQEMIQETGDRDFRGGLETIARLRRELSIPILVKETGAGISGAVGARLRSIGVEHVDVAGAGGTSWVAVETHRASGELKQRGEEFWDWGIPTAASLLQVEPLGFRTVIASGGLQSGLCVARAIALGATLGGFARPVLKALERDGIEGALAFLERVRSSLCTAMLLTGTGTLRELRKSERHLGPALERWRPARVAGL